MRKFKPSPGFSLIELLVVVGVIIILSVATFRNFFTRSAFGTLDSASKQVVATLREAASRSAAQEGATAWGVHLGNTTNTAAFYALFKTSYSSANTVGYYRLPDGVSYSTSSIALGSSIDVIFSQIYGIPSATPSITLNLTRGTATSTTIIVNSTGLISF